MCCACDWRAGSIILAGIIKQTPDGIPMCEIADRHLTWITTRSNPSEVVRPPGFHVDKSGRRKHMKFRNQAFLFTPAVLLAWFLLAAPVEAQFAQQGTKLIGTGAIGDAAQGWSASLSYDGNTAIVGGIGDSGSGAAWVFTRSGGVWSQQAKLVGTGSIGGEVAQGISVSQPKQQPARKHATFWTTSTGGSMKATARKKGTLGTDRANG